MAQMDLPPHGLWETHCFHAQQAAEKAIKAVLIAKGVDVPFTHDLDHLLGLVPGLAPPPSVREAAELTAFAVAARYPGADPPVTADERDRAARQAEAVVTWAAGIVEEARGGG